MKILIVLPVYNEEKVLIKNTAEVLRFCQKNFPDDEYSIIIADNKSTDKTAEMAQDLVKQLPAVQYLYLPEKGKGIAWRTAFMQNEADIYIVMDVDLAVDLEATILLVNEIKNGNDLIVGSRYLKDSETKRSFFREFVSKVYKFLVRKYLNTKISDFQCGFKAMNNKIKDNILVKTKDEGFFLDTELTLMAEKAGYKIKEIPVDWSAYRDLDRKSTVNVFETTIDYLCKVRQLKKELKKIKINQG
jgi:glycosyltransferase AglD